ncbi:hypothetical protein [uncultured Maricaulis sp.]|uniref:hypothetical protein n=1 Tax=uncultured Maricaulis sp. TaxID=174710 RepID=UPI0030DBA56E
MNITAKLAAAALLASIGMAGFSGAASAGTWHANAASCPDLREDRFDARHYTGGGDRREDFRDRRVIDCPAYAWNYYPDRYERRDVRGMSSPGRVYLDRSGRYYAVDHHGYSRSINVVIDYPRQRPVLGLSFGTTFSSGNDHARNDHRDRRDYRDRRGHRDQRDHRSNRRGHH